jgi:NADH-quinone oxidoreductase subunit N
MNALYVISGLGIVALVAEIMSLKKWLTAVMIAGLIVATGLVVLDWGTNATYFNGMVAVDKFSLAFTGLISIASIVWFWMFGHYFKDVHQTDKSALVLFAITGAVIMASFNNMAMLFLGIEILSISLYTLAGSRKGSLFSNEASFKYFLMGSFATGFLLLGIAFVYGATGSFQIDIISDFILIHKETLPVFFYAGVILMFIGLAFKISAVPFHFWAPDVYGGSPTSITALMSTVVKIAAVAAFFRIFSFAFGDIESSWLIVIEVVCFLTLVVANITAVYQNDVKRMLAYSSVGHVGYILLGFLANPVTSSSVILYYLSAYAVSSLGAFAILNVIERDQNNLSIENFNGLFKRNPFMAVAMTLALLSLAGIPPLPGFFGKYMVFALALENGFIGLVCVAVVTSLIGAYYYFRIIIAMFMKEPLGTSPKLSTSENMLTTLLIVLTILIGIFPNWLISLIGS